MQKFFSFLAVLGWRGVFSAIAISALSGLAINAALAGEWLAALSILVGAISAVIGILTYGEQNLAALCCTVVSIILTGIGLNQIADSSQQELKAGLIIYNSTMAACYSGNQNECQKGMEKVACHYLNSLDYLRRSTVSAQVNIKLPTEVSGAVEYGINRQEAAINECDN